jgi:hypothetical protein
VCTQLNATTPAEIEKKCKPVVTAIKTETYTTLCSTSSYSSIYIHKPSLSMKPYKPSSSSSTPVAPVVTYGWVKPSAPAYPVYNATTPVVAPTGTGVWPVAFTGAANIASVASGALALAMGALLL